MGLLDKALTIDSDEQGFSPDIESMVSFLKSAGKGLDFPSIFFTRLIKEFSIKKGALLLPEEEGKFVPWSVRGFDQTTSRRIRIPEDLMGTLKDSQAYSFIELKGTEIGLMKNFFSFREYSVTESLLIAPISVENQLTALLFISEGEILQQENHIKRDLLQQLSDSIGPLLLSRRENIVSKFEGIEPSADDLADKISRYISSSEKGSFILLSLSLSSFIERLMEKDPGSISYRIMQDILRLTKTLLAEKGDVLNKGSDRLVLLLKGNRKEEAELLVHQIGLSLGYFFKVDSAGLKLSHTMFSYPEDGKSAAELVDLL